MTGSMMRRSKSLDNKRLSDRNKIITVDVAEIDKKTSNRHAVRRAEHAPVLAEYVEMLEAVRHVPLTEKTWFCVAVCIETILCLFCLGLQADYACRKNCESGEVLPWTLVDHIFTLLAAVEVLAGVIAVKPKAYFVGRPRKGFISGEGVFHTLDFFFVLCRILDVWVLAPVGIVSGLKLLSAFRVMHLGWFASQFQLTKILRELWLIMAGMLDTLKTVVWVMLLLLLVLWVFAVTLTITVNDGTEFNYSPFVWDKEDLWGTVPKALFTLIQVLTNDNWSGHVVWPLVEANVGFLIIFLSFFILASLALLNTVVGAIVESTLRSSRQNEERNQRERQRLDVQLMGSLEAVFNGADTDGNGELDREELKVMLKQLHVKKTVNLLNMRGRDLDSLFMILDTDGKGVVKTDLFFRGCARLRGAAMARDLEILGNDLNRQCDYVDMNVSKVKTINDLMSGIVDVIEKTDKSVVRYDGDQEDPVIMARRQREYVPATKRLRTVKSVEHDEVISEVSSTVYQRPNNGGFVGHWKPPPPPPIPAHLLDKGWGSEPEAFT